MTKITEGSSLNLLQLKNPKFEPNVCHMVRLIATSYESTGTVFEISFEAVVLFPFMLLCTFTPLHWLCLSDRHSYMWLCQWRLFFIKWCFVGMKDFLLSHIFTLVWIRQSITESTMRTFSFGTSTDFLSLWIQDLYLFFNHKCPHCKRSLSLF